MHAENADTRNVSSLTSTISVDYALKNTYVIKIKKLIKKWDYE